MIQLLTLVQKAPGTAPNQRFRHEQWAPFLAREHGIALDFVPFESSELREILYQPRYRARKAHLVMRDALRRWKLRTAARTYDGVVVLREAMLIGGPLLEKAIVRQGIPLLYDFDDAIWRWERGVNGVMSLARMPWKVGRICRLATAVTVGNEYLAQYARQYNSSVSIVRTSIDMDRFPELPAPTEEPFTLVWTGSHSTLAHLDSIRPALELLGSQRRTRLRVVCDVAPTAFRNVELDFVRWRPESEAADLAPGHVGLMPLPDTDFTRGKCGCKALQYMAVGRPVIVSPVGMNTEIVRDGQNGLLASSQDEWVTQLMRLSSDSVLRARMGAAARRTVLAGFTARSSADAFAGVVRAALAKAGPVVHV